jgi:hypothetical protein
MDTLCHKHASMVRTANPSAVAGLCIPSTSTTTSVRSLCWTPKSSSMMPKALLDWGTERC